MFLKLIGSWYRKMKWKIKIGLKSERAQKRIQRPMQGVCMQNMSSMQWFCICNHVRPVQNRPFCKLDALVDGTRSLDWSLRDNYEKKTCHTKLCTFRCLISIPQILNLRSRNKIRGKLLLTRKLRHFDQREPFLTMLFTTNLSPLLITK